MNTHDLKIVTYKPKTEKNIDNDTITGKSQYRYTYTILNKQ